MRKSKKKPLMQITFLLLLMGITTFVFNTCVLAQGRKMPKNVPAKSGNAPTKKSLPAANNVAGSQKRDVGNSGNRTNNINSGNKKVSIDNSKKNVNVNIDNSKHTNINNSHNTNVRRNTYHPYSRPPYRYGGRSYFCYQPYHYHPYRPFYWGPVWHPWGFFITTLAVTAVVISIENQHYHYDQGVYYVQSGTGYTVAQAPVGATITTLPPNSQTVVVNETTNNYYYGGTYYEKSDKGYTVVPPTAGTIVTSLPEGGKEMKIGEQTYVKVGETYYQPTQKDGKDVYEVVQIDEDDK
jgi:hypothetical protein